MGIGNTGRLWCAFTTASMAIAYGSNVGNKPRVRRLWYSIKCVFISDVLRCTFSRLYCDGLIQVGSKDGAHLLRAYQCPSKRRDRDRKNRANRGCMTCMTC